MYFQEKIVIVTGGGTGIGRATSLTLSAKGSFIAVIYSKSKPEAEETVREIEGNGGRALAVKADVSKEDQVIRMVETVAEHFGAIHFLVNNASITRQLPFNDLNLIDDEIWDSLFSINVKGMFYCARAAAPHIKKSGGGAIVNIGSVAGVRGIGSSLPYAVSKSAVHGLTKSLAHALLPEIRVNCVIPGPVKTRWWAGNEDKLEKLADTLPLRRVSLPEDIAELVCTALSSKAMTGQFLFSDSGKLL